MIERTFDALRNVMGKPSFWAGVIFTLGSALLLNLITRNWFDPNMAYSNFLQNYVQVLALGVTTVASVAIAGRLDHAHEKMDKLQERHDELHDKHDAIFPTE